MRWIFLCFLMTGVRAISGEVSDTAVKLLRSLDGKLSESEVSESFAISPFCGPDKKERILDYWETRGVWAKSGEFSFSVLGEKVDDDLAAVLVGVTSPNDPDRSLVMSLGMVRSDGNWKVAPVESSFDNVGLGFLPEVKARVEVLESWMALERVSAMTKLRRSEMEKFRKAMEGAVSPETLAQSDAQGALQSFLDSAEEGNIDALVVWQGYLDRDRLPDRDWDRHLRATRNGMEGKDQQRVWRLLTSRKVMKVIVTGNGDDEDAGFLVGFLSSYETGSMDERINPVRFELLKTERGWRISLPAFFSYADEDSRTFRNARNDEFDWDDRQGVKQMFHVFEELNVELREKEAKAVLEGVIGDLKAGDLDPFLQRHFREEEKVKKAEKDDDPIEQQQFQRRRLRRGGNNEFDDRRAGRYVESVKWWGTSLKSGETASAGIAKFYQEGKIAMGVLSLANAGDSWKPKYQQVWMGLGDDGWMILPGEKRPMTGTYEEESEEAIRQLVERYKKDASKMEEEYLADVLKVVGLEDPKGKVATEDSVRQLVGEWRRIAKEEDMMALLKVSAVRKLPAKPTNLLRDLGSMRKGAVTATVPDQVIGLKVSGRFHGLSMMIDSRAGADRACPLILVVPTGKGHRVLVDIELPLETNKGIRLLNDDRMDGLAKEMAKKDFAALEELREWHQKVSRPVWDEWKKEQSAD